MKEKEESKVKRESKHAIASVSTRKQVSKTPDAALERTQKQNSKLLFNQSFSADLDFAPRETGHEEPNSKKKSPDKTDSDAGLRSPARKDVSLGSFGANDSKDHFQSPKYNSERGE